MNLKTAEEIGHLIMELTDQLIVLGNKMRPLKEELTGLEKEFLETWKLKDKFMREITPVQIIKAKAIPRDFTMRKEKRRENLVYMFTNLPPDEQMRIIRELQKQLQDSEDPDPIQVDEEGERDEEEQGPTPSVGEDGEILNLKSYLSDLDNLEKVENEFEDDEKGDDAIEKG
jgi:hypothetical protein